MSFPDGSYEPHSTHAGNSSTAVAYGVLLLMSIYYILQYFDFMNLPLSELVWNLLVCVTPSRLVSLLDSGFELDLAEDSNEKGKGFNSQAHASKSNAMRRILGLGGAGLMTTVQRTRTLSNLSGVFKATPKNSLPGLGNWDNSCYQNSVLQGLAALESLPEFLRASDDAYSSQPTKRALRETIGKLNDPENTGKTLWTPAELKSMSSWQQQDAQEYFSKISDQLKKDTAKDLARKIGRTGFQPLLSGKDGNRPTSPEAKGGIEVAASRRASRVAQLPEEVSSIIIRNPLEGLLAQRVGCQRCCYVEGLSMVPFNCLTVPLGRQWMYDVRECLDEYTALEPIGGVECAKCTLLRAKQQMEQLLSSLQTTKKMAEHSTEDPNRPLQISVLDRLTLVNEALDSEDFSDQVLKKCQIPPKQRVLTTKSRQAVVARAPRSLVIHINRSNFDELTGMQSKNLANVRFPQQLDLAPWSLGQGSASSDKNDEIESWNVDPSKSMLDMDQDVANLPSGRMYELRAVITHYGRHENGHYICYRRSPYSTKLDDQSIDESTECWWRLSDEDVTEVDEDMVLAQGGVFMLCYEQVEPVASGKEDHADQAEQAAEQLKSESSDGVYGATLENAASEPPAPVPLLQPVSDEQPTTVAYPIPPMSPRSADIPNTNEHTVDHRENVPLMIKPKTVENISTSIPLVPGNSLRSSSSRGSDPRAVSPSPAQKQQSSTPALPSISEPSDAPDQPAEQGPPNPVLNSVSPPSMRTSGPRSGRGSMSRAGKAMDSVAGFVQAN